MYAVGRALPERDMDTILEFVTLVMSFKKRLVTLNGGDPHILPLQLSDWLKGLLSNGAQQLSVATMQTHVEELKKALQIHKPVAEQAIVISVLVFRKQSVHLNS
jgi:hypothetical protein